MDRESVWTAQAATFMSLRHTSQERSLHPAVTAHIEAAPGESLLDYGCGDGRILELVSNRWSIDAFDPSAQMRQLAAARVGHRLNRLFADPADIASTYDLILLGMVLLCLPTKTEVMRVLRDCCRLMHQASRLLITSTHPCFRNARFSNFKTSFCDVQPFEYNHEGTPFAVTIMDPDGTEVTFTDYHWSLGFTVEALQSTGLSLVSLVEVGDDMSNPNRNPLVPPFLILECKKVT